MRGGWVWSAYRAGLAVLPIPWDAPYGSLVSLGAVGGLPASADGLAAR